MKFKKALILLYCAAFFTSHAQAQEHAPTSMLLGPLGLNTVPSARMDEAGTLKAGVSMLDPYVHAYLGMQLAKPLYVQLRQSAEVSDINTADRLYPGVDVKLRLLEENRKRPEVSLGMQSVIGHKRMAGEYIAASKRWNNFDFTGGVGWGRYAGRWKIPNLLGRLSSHFDKDRNADGEMPNQPSDWFTGEYMGVFAGVEYFTPIDGLSLKLDLGNDRYAAEKAAFNFKAPAPISFGVSYKPLDWMEIGVAAQGVDKIMARLTLTPSIQKWNVNKKQSKVFLKPHRSGEASAAAMQNAATSDGIIIYDTHNTQTTASTNLRLDPRRTAPEQFGEAAIYMANDGGKTIEGLKITPTIMGLRGPAVQLMRKDFENAISKHRGSPEDIWQHAEFDSGNAQPLKKLKRSSETWYGLRDLRLVLDQKIGVSEEDAGVLTRTSVIAGSRRVSMFGFLDAGYALRLNLFNNLDNVRDLRPRALLPARSN